MRLHFYFKTEKDKATCRHKRKSMPRGKTQRSPQERRADRALKELRKLQRDRVLAMDIHTEVYLFDKIVDIPATFPMFDVRKADLSKTSAGLLAFRLMAVMPEAREIVDKDRASKLAA